MVKLKDIQKPAHAGESIRVYDYDQWFIDRNMQPQTHNIELMRYIERLEEQWERLREFIGCSYDAESKTYVSGKQPYLLAGEDECEALMAAVDGLRSVVSVYEQKYKELQVEPPTWTTVKPTKPGWYWHRHVPTKSDAEIALVYYDYTGNLAAYGDRMEWITGVEWSSEPIPEPEEAK